ncbi:hypothetical protein GQ457_05G026340 [Hibiscus cannabinus]
MEADLTGLTIDSGEDDVLQLGQDLAASSISFANCFVGSFLTKGVINFLSMKTTLANVWKPPSGISVSDLGNGRYLFRLYHEFDVHRIDSGGPWHFNSHLLVLHILKDIRKFSRKVFLGEKRIMRIRVKIDVRIPLKQRKKFALPNANATYAHFQYEKLRDPSFWKDLPIGKSGVSLISGKSTMIKSTDFHTGCLFNQDPIRIHENYDVPMGVDSEDIPISHVEGLKRPRATSDSPNALPGLSTDMNFDAAWLVEDSCKSKVRRLWEKSTGSIPNRLRYMSRGLDNWFWKIRREKKLTVKDLQKRLEDLNEMHPMDDVIGEITYVKLSINLES